MSLLKLNINIFITKDNDISFINAKLFRLNETSIFSFEENLLLGKVTITTLTLGFLLNKLKIHIPLFISIISY